MSSSTLEEYSIPRSEGMEIPSIEEYFIPRSIEISDFDFVRIFVKILTLVIISLKKLSLN